MKTFNVILSAGAVVVCLSLTSSARASYASTVLGDNPLSFWQFNDASSADGATAFDSAPGDLSPGIYRNLGGVLPPISFVAGPAYTGGQGIQLNGTGSGGSGNFIDIPDGSSRLQGLANFSVEFWELASPSQSELYSRFLSHAAGGTANYWIGMETAGGNPGQPFVGVPGGTWYAWPPNILTDGSWNHVVVTYASSGGNMMESLYINSILEGTDTVAGAFSPSAYDLILGAENNQYYVYNGFVGDLADVAIYNQTLTQQQITAHYNAGAVPEPASIALCGLGLAACLVLVRRRHA